MHRSNQTTPDGGKKTYRGVDAKGEDVITWLGYKIHLLVEEGPDLATLNPITPLSGFLFSGNDHDSKNQMTGNMNCC